MADGKQRWSTAHAQLWTSIRAPEAPEHPLRTPPRAPVVTGGGESGGGYTPGLGQSSPSPARELVDVSALTVNNDTSVLSATAAGSIDKDAIIVELRAQLRAARREVAALQNQRARDTSAIASLAQEVRRAASATNVGEIGRAVVAVMSPSRNDPGTADAVRSLVEGVALLTDRLRALTAQVQSLGDAEIDLAAAADNEHDSFVREVRARALKIAYAVATHAVREDAGSTTANVLRMLAAVEERVSQASTVVQEVLCRCGVSRDEVPLTLHERAETLFAVVATKLRGGEAAGTSTSPGKRGGRAPAQAPSAQPKGSPNAAAATIGATCEAELRRVIDILGGDGDTPDVGDLPALASSQALRLAREKEQAAREASIASLALVEYEKTTRSLLGKLGVSGAPSSAEILAFMGRCANGEDDRAARDRLRAAEEALTADCGWVQNLTKAGERLLERLDLPLPARMPPTVPPTTVAPTPSGAPAGAGAKLSAASVRTAHERLVAAFQDQVATLLQQNRTLHITAVAATNLAERIIGVPPSAHVDANTVAALESRIEELRGFDASVLQSLRRLVPQLPAGTGSGDLRTVEDPDDPNVSLADVLDGVSAALAVNAALGDPRQLDRNALLRAVSRVDALLTTAEADWKPVLQQIAARGSGAPDLVQPPPRSANLSEALDGAARRSSRLALLLHERFADPSTAEVAPATVQRVVLQLARVISASGGTLPAGAAASTIDELLHVLDARVQELRHALQKSQRLEQQHRAERAKLENALSSQGVAVANNLHALCENRKGTAQPIPAPPPVALAAGAAATGGGQGSAASPASPPTRTFAEFYEPLLNNIATYTGEVALRIERLTQGAKDDRVRLANYAEAQEAQQRKSKRIQEEATKLATLVNVSAKDEAGKPREVSAVLALVAERLADTAGDSVDVRRLTSEVEELRAQGAEREETMRAALQTCMQNFAGIASTLKNSLLGLRADEGLLDERIAAICDGTSPQMSDDEVEDMMRLTILCATRYANRIDEFLAEHLQNMQKLVSYHQAIHQTITRSRAERHDATIEDIHNCLLLYADDVMLALNRRAGDASGGASLGGTDGDSGAHATSPPRAPAAGQGSEAPLPGPIADVAAAADHRLIRIAESVARLHNTISGIARVRYLQIPSAAVRVDDDALAEVPSQGADSTNDDVIRLLERNIGIVQRRATDFSNAFKSAVIVVEKDVDALQRDLDEAVMMISALPLEQYFPSIDRANLAEIHDMLSKKQASYFYSRPDGSGACPWSIATKHLVNALETITNIATERSARAKRFKNIIEAVVDIVAAYLQWRRSASVDGGANDIDALDEVADEDTPALLGQMLRELQASAGAAGLEEEVARLSEQVQLEREARIVATEKASAETLQTTDIVRSLRAERDAALSEAAMARAKLARAIAARARGALDEGGATLRSSRDASPLDPVRRSDGTDFRSAHHGQSTHRSASSSRGNHHLVSTLPVEYGHSVAAELRQRHLYSPERQRAATPQQQQQQHQHHQRPTNSTTGARHSHREVAAGASVSTPASRAASPMQRMDSRASTAAKSTLMQPTAASHSKTYAERTGDRPHERRGARTPSEASRPSSPERARNAGGGAGGGAAHGKALSTAEAVPFLKAEAAQTSSGGRWIGFASPVRPAQPAWKGAPEATPIVVPRHSVVVVDVPQRNLQQQTANSSSISKSRAVATAAFATSHQAARSKRSA